MTASLFAVSTLLIVLPPATTKNPPSDYQSLDAGKVFLTVW
jgi:hypothetical protein